MTVCDTCFNELKPDGTCPVCTQLDEPPPARAERVGPRPPPTSTTDAITLSVDAAPAPGDAEDSVAEEASSPEDSAPAQETNAHASDDAALNSESLTLADLQRLRDSDRPVIVLLGFPTAGKTWFLNRLKDHMGRQGFTHGKKAPNRTVVEVTNTFTAHRFQGGQHDYVLIDIPGERFLEAVKNNFLGVGEEDKILRHILHTGRAFLVLFPADEVLLGRAAIRRLRKAPPSGGEGASAAEQLGDQMVREWERLDETLAKLSAATARSRKATKKGGAPSRALKGEIARLKRERTNLVDVLSDDMIKRIAENEASLEEFIDGIGHVSKLISLMRVRGADLPPTTNASDIDDHKASPDYRQPTAPMFVVLAKADVLEDKTSGVLTRTVKSLGFTPAQRAVLASFGKDPAHTIATFRARMAPALNLWFEKPRIEFASAFRGHRAGKVINYDLPHKGIEDIVDWVLKEMRPRKPPFAGLLGKAGPGPKGGAA